MKENIRRGANFNKEKIFDQVGYSSVYVKHMRCFKVCIAFVSQIKRDAILIRNGKYIGIL